MNYAEQYPLFLESSTIGSSMDRLSHRYNLLFSGNRHLFEGKTVLDIGSHDGRWMNAALINGASMVHGVESRGNMIDEARYNMRQIGHRDDKYMLIQDSILHYGEHTTHCYDTVLCLGVFYHFYEHNVLMSILNKLTTENLIIDTYVSPYDTTACTVYRDVDNHDGARTVDSHSVKNISYAAVPSYSTLMMFLEDYGFDVVNISDEYMSKLTDIELQSTGIQDYARKLYESSKRVALLCKRRI